MSNYYETLEEIRRNMGCKKNIMWTSKHIADVLRTGTDGIHNVPSCRCMYSKLRTDETTRSRWSREIADFEAETGIKLMPIRHNKKQEEKKEVETHKDNSDLQLNIRAVKAMAETGMTYADIAKVIGKEETTVIALLKVAEAFA